MGAEAPHTEAEEAWAEQPLPDRQEEDRKKKRGVLPITPGSQYGQDDLDRAFEAGLRKGGKGQHGKDRKGAEAPKGKGDKGKGKGDAYPQGHGLPGPAGPWTRAPGKGTWVGGSMGGTPTKMRTHSLGLARVGSLRDAAAISAPKSAARSA